MKDTIRRQLPFNVKGLVASNWSEKIDQKSLDPKNLWGANGRGLDVHRRGRPPRLFEGGVRNLINLNRGPMTPRGFRRHFRIRG